VSCRKAAVRRPAFGFARDVLLYDQGGCLSPHAVLVEGDGARAADVGTVLAAALAAEAEALAVPAVDDPGVARTVREARDLTLFEPVSPFAAILRCAGP
jgi:hypothetical protein